MHPLDTKVVKEQGEVSRPRFERVRRGVGWAVTVKILSNGG